MRRSVDAAILELGALNDRDKILACFFEHASKLFDFSVLFVVRADRAEGRHVHGLGAPPALVARVTVPLDRPGVLAKARETRRPFVAAQPSEETDRTLFGMLGRVLPNPVVVPVLVKDRVVAIFMGEPAAALAPRAADVGRTPVDLAKDSASMLAEATGNTLERLILRRKNVSDSLLPPSFPSQPPGAGGAPQGGLPAIPRAPAAPVIGIGSLMQADTPSATALAASELPARRASGLLPLVAAGVLLVGGGAVGLYVWRQGHAERKDVATTAMLADWPKVDPLAAIEAARKVSDLDGHFDLALIEAEVGDDARVDFTRKPENVSGVYLRYEFLTDVLKSEVVVDSSGMHRGHVQRRETCGGQACQGAVPPPKCTLAEILEGAKKAGLEPGDRALVRYSGQPTDPGAAEWQLSVAGRSSIRIDAASCQPIRGEQLTPKALPIDKIPGAPSAVDPVEIVALARKQSGLTDAALLEMEIGGVMETGLVDLNVPDAGIAYVFAEPTGQQRRRWRRVLVRRDGIPIVSDEKENSPLPVRLYGLTTPQPRCSVAQARDYLTLGTIAPGPARMTYGPGIGVQTSSGEWSIEAPTLASKKTASDAECAAWANTYAKPLPAKKGR